MGLARRIKRLRKRKAEKAAKKLRRKAFFEPLEPRILLSADLQFVMTGETNDVTLHLEDGMLQVIDSSDQSILQSQALADTSGIEIIGSDQDDKLTIDVGDLDIFEDMPVTFTDSSSGDNDTLVILGDDAVEWTVSGSNQGRAFGGGFIDFTGIENLTGGAENEDTFIFSEDGSLSGVVEGGDAGFDSIVIDGGEYDTVTYETSSPDSGTIDLDSNVITYSGMEPITDTAIVADRVINASGILYTDNAELIDHADSGMTSFISLNDAFEDIHFANPTNSLTINMGGSLLTTTDVLTVESVDASFNASLIINGDFGDDAVTISTDLVLGGKDVRVKAETITVDAGVTISTSHSGGDSGDIAFQGQTITIDSGSNLLADTAAGSAHQAGNITLKAEDTAWKPYENLPIVGIANRQASITINDAILRGGDIVILAKADDSARALDLPEYVTDFTGGLVDLFDDIVDLLSGGFTGIDASVMIRSSDATVQLTDATISTSGSVDISAVATADASTDALAVGTLGLPISASVIYAEAEANANTILAGATQITAGGDISIASDASTLAELEAVTTSNFQAVGAPVNPFNISTAVAIGITDLTSMATVSQGTTIISSGGNVNINAVGNVVNTPSSESGTYTDGLAGLAASFGFDNSVVEAMVDGVVTAKGSTATLNFDAKSTQVVDLSENTFTIEGNGLTNGQQVVYHNGGTDIGGLTDGDTYTVIVDDATPNTIQLAKGASIDLDNADVDPGATHTFGQRSLIDLDAVSGGALDDDLYTVTIAGHGLSDGQIVTYSANGNDWIAGLEHGRSYKVVFDSTDAFQLKDIDTDAVIDFGAGGESTTFNGIHSFVFDLLPDTGFNPVTDVDAERNTVTIAGHGFSNGDAVIYRTDPSIVTYIEGGDTPGDTTDDLIAHDIEVNGLKNGETYFVTVVDSNTIRLASSETGAHLAAVIDLSSQPSGSGEAEHYFDIGQTEGVGITANLTAENKAGAGEEIGKDMTPGFEDLRNAFSSGESLVKLLAFSSGSFSGGAGGSQLTNEIFSTGSGVAVNVFDHDVTAMVGANADINSEGDVKVEATIEQAVQLSAEAEVSKPDGSTGLAMATAMGLGLYDNSAQAIIDSNAHVDASGRLEVLSEVSYPLLTPPLDLINPAVVFADGIDGLNTLLSGDLGVSSELMNTWIRTSAESGDDSLGFAVAGQLGITDYSNVSEALIKSGAQINQDAAYDSNAQSVDVSAKTDINLLEASGMISLGLNEDGVKDLILEADPLALISPFGSDSGVAGIGASSLVSIINNTTVAEIGQDAEVSTGRV